MSEQTRTDDDVKIPAQTGAPAEEVPAQAPEEAAALAGAGPEAAITEPQEAGEPAEQPEEPAQAAPERAEGPASAGVATEPVTAAPSADAGVPRQRTRLRDRRGLRAAVRWTAAVLVFAALGGAAAYAVTQPERTEIPGLRTPDDGRWTYPALKLPQLPAGAPRPLDGDHNRARRHYADLHTLLLPAPAGAKVDKALPGPTGWLPTRDFLELYQKGDRAKLTGTLEQNTLRHIAARAWTTDDGTRAEIYLLQFATAAYTGAVKEDLMLFGSLEKSGGAGYDTDWDSSDLPDPEVQWSLYNESKPRGPEHVRFGYVEAGDVLALVVLTKAGTQPAVPFHQTVMLQSQLLA
ncbi:hypothetical protein [Streptomyces sp. NPDC001070]